MTQSEVEAVFISYLTGALSDDYPDVQIVNALEAGIAFMVKGKPTVTITLDDMDPISDPCPEIKWRFLMNVYGGSQPYTKNTVYQASRDDVAFAGAIREAINDDGFETLQAQGIYQQGGTKMCRAWPEDQRDARMINPQLLSFSTF
jgi:hypothetical protein